MLSHTLQDFSLVPEDTAIGGKDAQDLISIFTARALNLVGMLSFYRQPTGVVDKMFRYSMRCLHGSA